MFILQLTIIHWVFNVKLKLAGLFLSEMCNPRSSKSEDMKSLSEIQNIPYGLYHLLYISTQSFQLLKHFHCSFQALQPGVSRHVDYCNHTQNDYGVAGLRQLFNSYLQPPDLLCCANLWLCRFFISSSDPRYPYLHNLCALRCMLPGKQIAA